MGFFSRFFRSRHSEAEAPYEIVENRVAIEDLRYQVRLKRSGTELYAEEFLQESPKSRRRTYSRFYLVNEKLPKTHFAPSLEEALSWFRGKRAPKDGYGTIFWGDTVTYTCELCHAAQSFPLRINKVEWLVIYAETPRYEEIVGWRVIEVEAELTGKGIPTMILENFKLRAIVKWHRQITKYVCQPCAQRLKETGREEKLSDYVVFSTDADER